MKEYDQVELIVEKECYAKDDVHIGMVGWICNEQRVNGQWLVSFDQYGELPEIACISVKEVDLKVITPSQYDVKRNTKILEDWVECSGLD